MASISRGYSFGATEQVTNSKLHSLVDSATLSGVVQSDLSSGLAFVAAQASAPSSTTQLWIDTSQTPPVARIYDNTNAQWVPVSEMGLLKNNTGQTGAVGRPVIIDTANDNNYKYTATAGDTKFAGIEMNTTGNGSFGPVINHGLRIPVLMLISASAGSYIRTTTATGYAEPATSATSGVFGMLMTSAASGASGSALIFGIDPNAAADTTANYIWTGNHTFNGNLTITTASGTTTNWTPIVQIVNTETGASAGGSTAIPFDDTIPQNTEGDQYMSLAITPKATTNNLYIDVVFSWSTNTTNITTIALYQDNNANAIACGTGRIDTSSYMTTTTFSHFMAAGTTSSTTFKVRAGATTGTITLNGQSSARKYGGVLVSSITITEIKV